MTRKITAHKGGRTKFVPGFLATPEVKNMLDEILTVRKTLGGKHFSLADWVAEKVTAEYPDISVRSDEEKA